jgi:hypothetical protein
MAKNIIKLNRGDSYEFKVSVPDKEASTKNYILTEADVVYFALLYPNQRFEDALIIRGYTLDDQDQKTGEISIKIIPNDTRCLVPGVYYYTVKLQRGGTLDVVGDFDEPEEVRTVIERTKFIINN